MNKSEKLRAGLYLLGSCVLKIAGIHGLVSEEESQIYLLALSVVFDLAFLFTNGNPILGSNHSGNRKRT